MRKKIKKNSPFLKFVNGINSINLMKGSNYYSSYCKVSIKKNYIHNIKELPNNKNTIKLALKRLIMTGYVKQEDDWYYVNLKNMEKVFVNLSQFQETKTKPINKVKSKKVIELYKKERKAFNEFIKLFRKIYFKKRIKDNLDIDKKITLGKSFVEFRILLNNKLADELDKI